MAWGGSGFQGSRIIGLYSEGSESSPGSGRFGVVGLHPCLRLFFGYATVHMEWDGVMTTLLQFAHMLEATSKPIELKSICEKQGCCKKKDDIDAKSIDKWTAPCRNGDTTRACFLG